MNILNVTRIALELGLHVVVLKLVLG